MTRKQARRMPWLACVRRGFSLHQILAVTILLLITLLMSACVSTLSGVIYDDNNNRRGNVHVTAVVPLAARQSMAGAHLALTQSNQQLEFNVLMEPVSTGFAATVTDVPAGNWQATVTITHAEGHVSHHGATMVPVRKDQTVHAEITVKPKTGKLIVEADITGMPWADEVKLVRLTLPNRNSTQLKRVEEDSPGIVFTGEREYAPGDHDFIVNFYRENATIADTIYVTPAQTVRIEPGQTVFLRVTPELGAVVVEARFINMPEPPTAPAVETGSAETPFILSWQPSTSTSVVRYNIYHRKTDIDFYEQVAVTQGSQWPIVADLRKDAGWFVVTSMDAAGVESFRSEAVWFPGPI